ncbi:hypothetical protein [Streptomyces sp. NPDC015125]|uniref:hypothetical protein n=1 Tax=Streptomyces sp. NPDC015125 TaxID=3364938 RepID=UPI0036F8FBDB
MTFQPGLTGHGLELRVSLVADVSTRFRIPLHFSVHFHSDGAQWELHRIDSKQRDSLTSVQAVRDRVGEHASQILEKHLGDLESVVVAGREIVAARTLDDVLQARADVARAQAREQQALATIAGLGVGEERAGAVHAQLRARERHHFFGQ